MPEYDIPIDYNISKRSLYTLVTRFLLSNILLVVLWVESPEWDINAAGEGEEGKERLPSWVPDFMTRQSAVTLAMNASYTCFSAGKGFPAISEEPRFRQSRDCERLALRVLRVAVVRQTWDTRLTHDPILEGTDKVRLFTYELISDCDATAGREHDKPPVREQGDSEFSFQNTNWGPCHCEVGDVIVVAAGCNVPLIVRENLEEGYLFVGGCWLIDGMIRDLTELKDDPGFSPLMFGSACVGDDVEGRVEEIMLV